MQIHELNLFTGRLDFGTYFVVDDGNDTGKRPVTDLTLPLSARIENIITSPAPTEEEIIDARVPWNTVIPCSSLGEAIRSQSGKTFSQIYKFNVCDLLTVYGLYLNRTDHGVTFTWDDERQICGVSGEAIGGNATGTILTNNTGNRDVFKPNHTYNVGFNSTDDSVKLEVIIYREVDGQEVIDTQYFTSDGTLTLPADVVGLEANLLVEMGESVSATVRNVYIIESMTAEEVSDAIRDALIGADGVTYNSLGDSIRGQMNEKADNTDVIKNIIVGGSYLIPDASRTVEIPVDENLTEEHVPADAQVVGDRFEALRIEQLLQMENIPDTTQATTFVGERLTQVVHTDSDNETIRTDTFAYSTSTITETRTLYTGDVLTIVLNLTTLQTAVAFTAA